MTALWAPVFLQLPFQLCFSKIEAFCPPLPKIGCVVVAQTRFPSSAGKRIRDFKTAKHRNKATRMAGNRCLHVCSGSKKHVNHGLKPLLLMEIGGRNEKKANNSTYTFTPEMDVCRGTRSDGYWLLLLYQRTWGIYGYLWLVWWGGLPGMVPKSRVSTQLLQCYECLEFKLQVSEGSPPSQPCLTTVQTVQGWKTLTSCRKRFPFL